MNASTTASNARELTGNQKFYCQASTSDLHAAVAELLLVAMNTRLAVPDSVLRLVKELFDLVRPEMKLRDVIPMLRHNKAVIRIALGTDDVHRRFEAMERLVYQPN